MATSLAEAGAHLSLVARNQKDLEHAQSQIKELSPDTIVHIYPFDMTQINSISDLFRIKKACQFSYCMNG